MSLRSYDDYFRDIYESAGYALEFTNPPISKEALRPDGRI